MIVGAGTFGASLAWTLARAGEEVVLVDQFEPGDRRATSGGETRLIRCGHGADAGYTASARRARTLWRELEAESGTDLLIECGLVWFARRRDGWEAASEQTMRAQGIPVERLGVEEGRRLFPSFRGEDLEFLLHEPEAGVLRAQRATETLAARAQAHGARLARGLRIDSDRLVVAAAPDFIRVGTMRDRQPVHRRLLDALPLVKPAADSAAAHPDGITLQPDAVTAGCGRVEAPAVLASVAEDAGDLADGLVFTRFRAAIGRAAGAHLGLRVRVEHGEHETVGQRAVLAR